MDLSAFPNITDPSDFPAETFRKVDSSLRCTICKDFYDGPVILHCGHSFCSLCIRSVLRNKQECPVCRVAAKETHLVRNSMFSETVKAWSEVRAFALERSKPSTRHTFNYTNKRKQGSPDPSQEAGPSRLPYTNRNNVKSDKEENYDRSERPKKTRRLPIEEDIITSSDPEEQELPNPTTKNSSVSCPSCSRQVPYNSINSHLDSNCKKFIVDDTSATPKPDSKSVWGTIFKGQGKKPTNVSSAQDFEIPTTRIAKVSYGLLNLSALRKLLVENGLPTSGDKDELIARHERWVAIYNANLDRGEPKSVGELKEYLKEREEAENRPGPKKVVDEKAWAQKNSAQFNALIAAARPKPKAPEGDSSSETNDPLLHSSPLVTEKDNTGMSSNVIVID